MNQFSHLKSMKDGVASSRNLDGSQIVMSNAQTSENLMQHHGRDEWIASQRASLVRIFHVLDQATGSKERGRALSGSYSKQLTLLNHQLFFSKIPPESGQKAGVKLSRLLWRGDIPGETERLQPLMSAQAIKEIDGGALPPMLTVCGNWNRKGVSQNSGDGLATAIRKLPTLTARDYKSPGTVNAGKTRVGTNPLPWAMRHLLPTLTKSDGTGGPGRSRKRKGGLNLWTALSELLNSEDFPILTQKRLQSPDFVPGRSAGHRLTPAFAEWWMGWPIGWTALKPAETGKSQSRRQ
jgi:hypothetical protein